MGKARGWCRWRVTGIKRHLLKGERLIDLGMEAIQVVVGGWAATQNCWPGSLDNGRKDPRTHAWAIPNRSGRLFVAGVSSLVKREGVGRQNASSRKRRKRADGLRYSGLPTSQS